MRLERGVHGMTGALPGVDDAAPVHLRPAHVEGQAGVAHPLRAPLPRAALGAALGQQLAPARALPVRAVEAVGLGHGRGQARGQVVRGRRHSVASAPRIRLDTGVTMGPEITMDTAASGTWPVDSPRSWRTASITSSSPCM